MVHILKLNKKEARACLRVATRLEELPLIAYEAERGMIGWAKLRDTIRKVTPRTEEYWLELYARLTYKQLMRLAARTPVGGIPGDPWSNRQHSGCGCVDFGEPGNRPDAAELTCRLDSDADAIVSRGLRALSREEGRVVSFSEAVVLLFADYLSGAPGEPAGEAQREEECRHQEHDEEVEWARGLAGAMGLGNSPARDNLDGDELFEALVAYEEESVPDNDSVVVARRDRSARERIRFNPDSRCPTPAQRHQLIRREGYCCAVPAARTTSGWRPTTW